MARYDLENFRDYFINLVKANIAAKLAEITAEKADGIILEGLSNDQYASSLSQKVMNFNTFLLYHFPDIRTIQAPDSKTFSLEVTMTLDIWTADPEGGDVAENKIMRYTRAISEIITENIDKNPMIRSIEIEVFSPLPLILSQNSQLMRVGGVQLKGFIA